jgi:hypothetical protein
MGPFSTVVLVAGLTVLRWVFFVTGALFVLLVLAQAIRQEEAARPILHLATAAAFLAAGWLSGFVVKRMRD